MRVIMVDDSAADRKLCRALLEERHGSALEFIEARDAVQGLDLCRATPPDCVLLDYKLPDMTGLEFLGHLTRDAPADLPTFAVVMLTSVASEQVAVQALKGGAQDYLVKDSVTLVVQVNGKKRGEITVATTAENPEIEAAVLALDAVKSVLGDKPARKVIIVPKRIVNVVG